MKAARTIVATIVAAGGVAVVPGVAHACSCVPPPPPHKAVADYDAVFSGVVAVVEDPQKRARIVSSAGPVHYTFDVDAVAKGPRRRTIEVSSALGGASCGAEFHKGRRYLVFAYYGSNFKRVRASDSLWTNLCTPNEELGPDEALPVAARRVGGDEIVGPPRNPPAPGPSAAVVIAASVAVVVAGGLLIRARSARAR